jgi:hypothetical protein
MKPRRTTFKYEYFCKFETQFKNILKCEFGDYMGSIRGKTGGQKSRATVPLRSGVGLTVSISTHINFPYKARVL